MLKKSSFKSIAVLQNRYLGQLQHKLSLQQQLTYCVKTALPKPLAEHVLYSILRDAQLIIYTDSANWASQLRFHSRMMADTAANSTGLASVVVQIKIMAKPNVCDAKPRKAVIPSAEKIEALRQCGDTVKDDQLKNALLKLSNTLTRLGRGNG